MTGLSMRSPVTPAGKQFCPTRSALVSPSLPDKSLAWFHPAASPCPARTPGSGLPPGSLVLWALPWQVVLSNFYVRRG